MSIFDNNVTNHDEYIESQFAVSMIETPYYCIQHAYYGYVAEQLIAKSDDLKRYYGCKFVNLEIKICELFYVMTGHVIDEERLGIMLHRIDLFLSNSTKVVIKYKGMIFYNEGFEVDKDIANLIHSMIMQDHRHKEKLNPWVQVIRYIKGKPMLGTRSKMADVW